MNLPRLPRLSCLFAAAALAALPHLPLQAQTAPPSDPAEPREQPPVKLSPFEVSESSNSGYGATNTTTASRVAQAYIDVPQTVNVLTSEYLNDLNIIDERAMLQNVPNVLLGFDVNNSRIIRASQVNATYLDGIIQINTTQAPPMQFYDRVEIVKGPSSAGFGVGEPGGIINYVSKVPTGVDRTTVSFGIGDYSNYKFNLDTQGVLAKDPKLSYRLDVMWDKGDYKVPVWYHRGAGAQLALKYQLDPDTTLQLITAYSDILTPADPDLADVWHDTTLYTVWRSLTGDAYPAFPNTPKNPGNSVQDWARGAQLVGDHANFDPEWGGYEDKVFTQVFLVDHNFGEHFHARNTFEISTSNYTYREALTADLVDNPVGYPPGVYSDISRTYQGQNAHALVDDLDFLVNYQFGKWADSKTLIGGVYNQMANTFEAYQAANVDSTGKNFLQNDLQPSRAPLADPAALRLYTNENAGRNFGTGWYVQEDLGLFDDHLLLSASWRTDYEHSWGLNYLNQTSGNLGGWKSNGGVPRYSVTVKPAKWLSIYELYSEHADPLQSTAKYFIVNGTPGPAVYAKYHNFGDVEYYNPGGKLVESGIKGTFLDGRLTFSFDFFHEINTGQAFGRVAENVVDPVTGAQQYQIGTNLISGVNAHGYEWEIFGQPTKRLSLIVNYGQTKGHYPNFADGQPHWWAQAPGLFGHGKYDFGDLKGNGLYVTFGGQYFWGYFNYQDPYVWRTAGQYTVDGGIGYRWDHGHQSIYLNDNNFTNQVVVVGNTDNVPWTVLPHEQGYVTYSYTF